MARSQHSAAFAPGDDIGAAGVWATTTRTAWSHSFNSAPSPADVTLEMVFFALAVLLIVVLIAIPFVGRRSEAVRNGGQDPASGKERALVVSIVAINTVPYAPIWPGSSGGDGFIQDWITIFVLLSLPFWLIALVVWRACRQLPRHKRCLIAELPAFVLQAAFWSLGYPLAVAVIAFLRAMDGALLFSLTQPAPRDVPAVTTSAA